MGRKRRIERLLLPMEDMDETWHMGATASSIILKCINGAVDGDEGSVVRRGDPSTQSVVRAESGHLRLSE